MSQIPTKARQVVRERQGGQCARCGVAGSEWHHRRRRGVKLGHDPHCACIGVLLCGTCHRDVHKHPAKSRETGYIIATYEEEPWTIPMKTFAGWVLQDCVGNVESASAPSQ